MTSTAASQLFSSSLLLMRCLDHKQVMIYGIACWWTQSISKSGKIDVHRARSESGHSVWSQSQHPPSPLVLMLAYSLVSSLSIPHPHPLFNFLGPILDPFLPSSLCHCMVYPKWFNYQFFSGVRQMKGKRDGSAVPNLIIYLLNRLLCYSPRAVVTDGCWEVKWAKRFVRMLPLTKLMQHCIGNLCQIQIRHISFK